MSSELDKSNPSNWRQASILTNRKDISRCNVIFIVFYGTFNEGIRCSDAFTDAFLLLANEK
jgi:hypothetical protein